MENLTAIEAEHENQYLDMSFVIGLKPDVATLLSPLSSRPKGI